MNATESLGKQYLVYTGPLFIGTIFNWALLGSLTIQIYFYAKFGFKDNRGIVACVASVYILDLLQSIFATWGVWDITVLGWGDPTGFVHQPWSLNALIVLCGAVAAEVQLFFAWRLYMLRNTKLSQIISITVALLAVMQFLASLYTTIKAKSISVPELQTLKPSAYTWLIGALVCDVIIAGDMLAILYVARIASPFESTQSLLDRLMMRTIQSGAITAVAALVELILFSIYPDNLLHIGVVMFLGKLYSNVLLANLNGRRITDGRSSVRQGTSGSAGFHLEPLPGIRFPDPEAQESDFPVKSQQFRGLHGVQVTVEEEVLNTQ